MIDQDGTVVLLHGTTERNAASIREHGFRRCDPEAMVRIVADGLGLDFNLIWDSAHLGFVRQRTDLDHCFFTMSRKTASEYHVPEVVQDALRCAFRYVGHGDPKLWCAQEAQRLFGAGCVLEVRVPWNVIGAHAFGRTISADEWREMGGKPEDLQTFSIPVSILPRI